MPDRHKEMFSQQRIAKTCQLILQKKNQKFRFLTYKSTTHTQKKKKKKKKTISTDAYFILRQTLV